MFDNKTNPRKFYKQGNVGISLTTLYKKIIINKWSLGEKGRVREKPKLSNKLVGFILGVLSWNKSFMWDELSNTLLNIFGKNVSSRIINLVLIVQDSIWIRVKLRSKFNEDIRELRPKLWKESRYISNNSHYIHKWIAFLRKESSCTKMEFSWRRVSWRKAEKKK